MSTEPTAADRARGLIIGAMSWSETFDDGRLGYERAEALLADHETHVRAAARKEGRQEVRAAVEALAKRFARIGADEIAHQLRAAVAPTQPADGER